MSVQGGATLPFEEEHNPQLLSGSYNTSISFDVELREILWRRTRLLLVLGLVATSVVLAMSRVYALEPAVEALRSWQFPLHLVNPLSFAVALGVIHVWNTTRRQLEVATFWVIAFNLVTMILALAILYPGRETFLPVALLLFVHAAFIPCKPSQVMLAAVAIATVALAYTFAPLAFSEVGAYWAQFGARGSFFERSWSVFGVSLLAVASVVVSRTLYSLHRSAHRAKRLGNYVIEEELGKGGMGEVYRARHALICRPTAVKVVRDDGLEQQSALARFEREVQLSASLTHENTITVFDYGRTSPDTFYYAMEYLDGMDLQRMVEQFGPLPASRAIHLLVQACGSLAEAHRRGVVHRDIKPSNIFVTHRGGVFDFVKVLDFGLARQIETDEDNSLTKTGMVFGTPKYFAPEAVYGSEGLDGRSDLYNLGGVAYWILTGQPVFGGSTKVDLIINHVKTPPISPREVAELPVPEALDSIIMKCLEKDPDQRFQSAEDLELAMRAIPLQEPWDRDKAKAWWEIHAPEETVVSPCHPCAVRDAEEARP